MNLWPGKSIIVVWKALILNLSSMFIVEGWRDDYFCLKVFFLCFVVIKSFLDIIWIKAIVVIKKLDKFSFCMFDTKISYIWGSSNGFWNKITIQMRKKSDF